MSQRRRFPLFHPSTWQILSHNNRYKLNYQYNHNNNTRYRSHYALHSREIIAIAQRSHKTTNPIHSFYQRRKLKANAIKPYFDVDKQQLQQVVNRLNIQTRLSRKQLEEQETNGYRKIKVSYYIVIFSFFYQSKQKKKK